MALHRLARVTVHVMAALVLAAPAARAQSPVVLMPGETRPNIPAAGRVILIDGDSRRIARVTFDRPDTLSQNMRIVASNPPTYFPEYGTARARGRLQVDFCVAAPGAVSGCGTEPATPEYITAILTFHYGLVGRVAAFGFALPPPGSSQATFQATASVVDTVAQEYLAHEVLENSTVRGGTKIIKMIPIPIPGHEDATITDVMTFSLILRRGRVYTFQLAAAASSTQGLVQNVTAPDLFYAFADFDGPVPGFQPMDGFVQLHNLTINVSHAPTLAGFIQALQNEIARLIAQLDLLRAEHRADIEALRDELLELRRIVVGPGRHPRAPHGPPGSGLPAPPPTSGCPGVAPAQGWLCVKGGWVPPDHPLARGGG